MKRVCALLASQDWGPGGQGREGEVGQAEERGWMCSIERVCALLASQDGGPDTPVKRVGGARTVVKREARE